MSTEFHIGIDDTDSDSGGCTTYTAAILFQELWKKGIQPIDYPWLVRLNPNVPWKTRGNGALSIHLAVGEGQIETVRCLAMEIVEANSDMFARRTDPAIVFLKGRIPRILHNYSVSALHDVLSVSEARAIARKVGAETCLLKGVRGLIGSLAAIGARLDSVDHTFEIIAYRTKEKLGTPRLVDRESIREMDTGHRTGTFHNLDPESGRVLICPHGPDPVLLGIRGLTPEHVQAAFGHVRIKEPVERIMIFKTNQGTDAHLTKTRRTVDLVTHQSAVLTGRVETVPRVLRGGHVIFELRDDTGSISCAAYAPTRSLMNAARDLLPGDHVRVYGAVSNAKRWLTFNIEKIEMLQLVEKVEKTNPLCSLCGCRCESMGQGQGFRCKKCGLRDRTAKTIRTTSKRNLQLTTYIASVGARRHLSRPDIEIPS